MVTEKILIVDDEESVCKSVKKILSRKGYEVADALNVADAVRQIQETPFDLVITDLMMPKTSGLELLQIVRDHFPELDVIMITGYASIESAVKAVKLGAAGYLPKPFTPDELTSLTEKALQERRKNASATPARKSAAPSEKDDIVDVDMPFSVKEVEMATSPEYVEALTHSDVPLAKKASAGKAYCYTGKRECARVVKEGRECPGECPIEKKEKARAAKAATRAIAPSKEPIDVDLPFSMSEVEKIAGPDYIACLDRDIPRVALYGRDASAKHSVLVVDDEPIVCHSVRRILSKKSCTVEEAFDVDVAMQKLKLNRYGLVILDLKMPKRSGMEVLQSIRKQYPNLPVVMVSGYASIESAIEAIRLGASNYIPKPFTPEELSKVAVEALAA